jgi:hypothetical protein
VQSRGRDQGQQIASGLGVIVAADCEIHSIVNAETAAS